jgi:multiple sugar transport system permease protein
MALVRRIGAYTVLTLFAVVFVFPFLLSVATSFKSRPDVAAHPVGLFNSVLVTVLATLGRIFIDSLAGYALARLQWRGRGLVFGGILAILAVPPIVLTVPRFLVLKELNLLNSYPGLVLPLAVDAVGIFLMKQFFEHLPRELEEAARIDGPASTRRTGTSSCRWPDPR